MPRKNTENPGRATLQLPEGFIAFSDAVGASRAWLARAVLKAFGEDDVVQERIWNAIRVRPPVEAVRAWKPEPLPQEPPRPTAVPVESLKEPKTQRTAPARPVPPTSTEAPRKKARAPVVETPPAPVDPSDHPRPTWLDDGCDHAWHAVKNQPDYRYCPRCTRVARAEWLQPATEVRDLERMTESSPLAPPPESETGDDLEAGPEV